MKATQELTMRAAEYYFEMDEFFKGYVTQKRININYWTNVNDATTNTWTNVDDSIRSGIVDLVFNNPIGSLYLYDDDI